MCEEAARRLSARARDSGALERGSLGRLGRFVGREGVMYSRTKPITCPCPPGGARAAQKVRVRVEVISPFFKTERALRLARGRCRPPGVSSASASPSCLAASVRLVGQPVSRRVRALRCPDAIVRFDDPSPSLRRPRPRPPPRRRTTRTSSCWRTRPRGFANFSTAAVSFPREASRCTRPQRRAGTDPGAGSPSRATTAED